MSPARRRAPATNILYSDGELLVVDKPSGVLLSPGRGGAIGLPDLLRGRQELLPEGPLLPANRLHEQASGVVVYARTPAAERSLVVQFSDGRAETTYLVLVTGYVEDNGEIQLPLYYDKRAGRWRASQRRGRSATTCYRIVERVTGHTLLECRAVGERPDQIRAHLAAIGHPLAIDAEFGGGSALSLSDYKTNYRPSTRHAERPLMARLTLHAARVSCVHPRSGSPMEFAAPLPRDLRATLAQLRRLS